MIHQQIDGLILYLAPLASAIFLLYAVSLFVKEPIKRRWYKYSKADEQKNHLKLIKRSEFSSNNKYSTRFSSVRPFVFKNNLASRRLLNESEKDFFRKLSEALPYYYIFPQVSFNALVTHAHWISSLRWQRFVRRKFNTKYVDFVLCKKSDFEAVAIVEYDGRGHNDDDDERRDEMLKITGYRIERFTGEDTINSIKARFDDFTGAA